MPKVDKSALKTDEVDYVVQVNGKLRGQFTADANASKEELLGIARSKVASFLEGKTERNAILVSHRQLINIVVS